MYGKSGLSMIELLICLSIICALACTLAPCSRMLQSANLEACSKELLSDMRLAKQRAMSEGCECKITFNSADNSYNLLENTKVYKSKKLPHNISFYDVESTYLNNTIAFDSAGNASPLPSCKVSLINDLGQHKEVVIGFATGYIYIKA